MTTNEKVARRKLSLLELAKELNNVSKACKLIGYSRQQFYEIRRNYQTYGAEGLLDKLPGCKGNAVHLSGAALRFTGKRVFDIFTALGLDGLGRFSMNMTPMQPRNSANLRGVWAGDNAPAITAIWFAMN